MQKIRGYENEGYKGGKYAGTEEELYEKAVTLLEKCRIANRPSDQKVPESAAGTSPTIVQRPGAD